MKVRWFKVRSKID